MWKCLSLKGAFVLSAKSLNVCGHGYLWTMITKQAKYVD